MNFLKIGIEFIITFLFILVFYYIFCIRKYKKDNKNIPIEVNLILLKNKINAKKVNLDKMIKVVSVLTSLILAISITILSNLSNNILVSLLVGVSFSIILAIIIYGFVGRHYKKKAIKNK